MAKIVEVTNPVTGQPTQVDQLEHTAQQIDDAVSRSLPGGYYDKWVSQLPGQNLLDNSVFLPGCLVDQRGGYVAPPGVMTYSDQEMTVSTGATSRYFVVKQKTASYAYFEGKDGTKYYFDPSNAVRGYTGEGYGPDRWKASAGAQSRILIFEDHVAFTNTATSNMLRQDMEKPERLKGKLVTLAMLLESATDGCVTKAYIRAVKKDGTYVHKYSEEVTEKNLAVATLQIPDDVETIYLGCVNSTKAGSTSNVYAASLDLGDHQKHFYQDENGNWQLNALPNYADTLARCQRYQLDVPATIASGILTNAASELVFFVNTPVSMRAKPAISYLSIEDVRLPSGTNVDPEITSYSISRFSGGGVTIVAKTSTFSDKTNNTPAEMFITTFLDANL